MPPKATASAPATAPKAVKTVAAPKAIAAPVAAEVTEEEVTEGGDDKPSRPVKTQEEIDAEVADLLDQLQTAETKQEKAKIRAKLRTRGHRGGLNRPRATEGEAAEPTEEAPAVASPAPVATPKAVTAPKTATAAPSKAKAKA